MTQPHSSSVPDTPLLRLINAHYKPPENAKLLIMTVAIPNKDSYVRIEGLRVYYLPFVFPIQANGGLLI